jgi:hypothetical protein
MRYEKPVITDFGSIAAHTFQTPGKGDKGVCGHDPMFGEPSCSSDENGFS